MFILTTVMSAPHKITLEEINMKKIVALVLSMVMALSLAAVAFGLDYIQGNNVWNIKADGSVIYGTSEAYAPVKYVDAVVNADGSGSVGYYVLPTAPRVRMAGPLTPPISSSPARRRMPPTP